MRALTIATLLTALAAPAAAEEDASPAPAWVIQLGPEERISTTSSAVTLTESNLSGAAWMIERRVLTVGLPGPFPVADVTAGLGFEHAGAEGETFDQLVNELDTWALTGSARLRVPLRSWLLVQARGTLGGGKTSVRISDRVMQTAIHDDGAMAVGGASVGLAVLPRLTRAGSRRFHLGFETELGYQVTSPRTIHATPEDRPAPELTIPARYASIGDLRLDGWVWRFGVVVGF
jgi:hypothetical protein